MTQDQASVLCSILKTQPGREVEKVIRGIMDDLRARNRLENAVKLMVMQAELIRQRVSKAPEVPAGVIVDTGRMVLSRIGRPMPAVPPRTALPPGMTPGGLASPGIDVQTGAPALPPTAPPDPAIVAAVQETAAFPSDPLEIDP